MSQAIRETIFVDLGDRYSTYCVVEQETGEECTAGCLRTRQDACEAFFKLHPHARVVIEVGTHSAWASRTVAAQCAETYVANAR